MDRSLRFALLGDPVAHSRSPAIHAAALRLAGLSGTYEAIKADPTKLSEIIRRLRDGQYHGLNITMPLKDAAAQLVGSSEPVNTLRLHEGQIEGISTDRSAVRELLSDVRFAGLRSVLLLGSGGSSRSAILDLADRDVYLAARNESVAAEMADSQVNVEVVPWGAAVAGALVINATPVGMQGETLPAGILEVAGGLIDLPYGSTPTPSVLEAVRIGLPTADGFEFLARQAAASFEWWTGVSVDSESLSLVARNV